MQVLANLHRLSENRLAVIHMNSFPPRLGQQFLLREPEHSAERGIHLEDTAVISSQTNAERRLIEIRSQFLRLVPFQRVAIRLRNDLQVKHKKPPITHRPT